MQKKGKAKIIPITSEKIDLRSLRLIENEKREKKKKAKEKKQRKILLNISLSICVIMTAFAFIAMTYLITQ